ncbi:hypothetical protein B0H14DRAFT_3079020 [Mycena olivaceomarginata]|nr:hypothetical protein B0H14DRAFT_3079020 [Mycena olivaceomarginata]
MNGPHLTIHTRDLPAVYSDSRTHTPQGHNVRISTNPDAPRNVRLPRATPSGGTISRSEDGKRCAVAGTEYLRIIRVSDPEDKTPNPEHKSSVGTGGYRLDASRNMWEGSGLKIDSAITDVAWCHGLVFNHKILTSARNGDLIMWDLNKTGPSKYERKTKDHLRSVHKLAVSHIVHHYCITGSADGDLRVWDIREMEKSIMRIHHPTAVRGVAFSPSSSQPLQAIVGLDNGSIYRCEWGNAGLLDRLPVAHTASVTSLDWHMGPQPTQFCLQQSQCICRRPYSHKPTYTLHPSFPVRHVLWRPGYECEIAVVSNANAEFGSGNFSELTEPTTGPAYASAPGSWLGESRDTKHAPKQERGSGVGDAVEIWDARRGWIAKWTVRGSAIEGGVTDIAFRDSHAIWATHSSGMFSQIDLRDATRPVDAIPRMAAAWEASGSLSFVADRKVRWEVPYDDVRPGFHPTTEDIRARKLIKSIGDEPSRPNTQVVGTYASESLHDDVDMFTKLAKAYVFEGQDRQTLCEMNARVRFPRLHAASEVGKVQVAQTWLLLASCLTSLVPELPPTPPTISASAHAERIAGVASNYSFPPVPSDSVANTNSSPGRNSSKASSHEARSSTASSSRKLTPTSRNASSPRLQVGSLPHVTPRPILGIPGVGGNRRPSHYRKPSMASSLPMAGGASPSNTRHIGEGALDDSDSSSSGSGASTGVDVGDEMTLDGGAPSSDDDSAVVSPSLMPTRMMTTSHPSPLSKIATLQHWPEHDGEEVLDNVDDEEASSPSPMSTDTDTSTDEDGNLRFKSPRRRQKSKSVGSGSRRRSATRLKSRSRSSTLASLAAPGIFAYFVTAGDTSFPDANNVTGLKAEETLRDIRPIHRHQKSQAVSDFLLDQKEVMEEGKLKDLGSIDESKLTERRMEFVHAEEDSIRTLTWEILREALESFSDEGDVQTCAMLAMVAPRELNIGRKRIVRFLESYIASVSVTTTLVRPLLVRKIRADVRQLETQIHTSCGKCRKPLVVPAGTQTPGILVKGWLCFFRLPVRSLLFQCSICHHGGHQECYRRYYMEHPMVPIPSTSVFSVSESRGRRRGRTADDVTTPKFPSNIHRHINASGHPCVSGCGHWCWAATDEI